MVFRTTILFLILIGCPAWCQPAGRKTDEAFYDNLFRNAVNFRQVSAKLRVVMVLTDSEVEAFHAIASDCVAKSNALEIPHEMIFESRLQAAQYGQVSQALAAWFSDRERQQREVIAEHITQLKIAFGAARFAALNSYLHSPEAGTELDPARLPAVAGDQKPRPVRVP
jgi:hypothetical protein